MDEIYRPWTAEESLGELTLHRDWDYMASMISSLRVYLFDHGTIPTWNFLVCGGRPELAIPSSWAYSWPSLFAYLLPPNLAIITTWVILSAIGFWAVRALLLRWTGSSLGALAGAGVYVFSGYFAVRFNLGQVGFSFFHLVPVLMWIFERAYAPGHAGKIRTAPIVLMTLASFAFFTSGIPQGLMFFYPAFLLLIVFRIVESSRGAGWGASLGAAGAPLLAHLLGLWMAAYKIWPPIRWQLDHPRFAVLPESYDLGRTLGNTLDFVPHYIGPWKQAAWQVYPAAGYNAFVGLVPWLLALLALAALAVLGRRSTGERLKASTGWTIGYALALLFAGLSLSLGNDNPWSPASLFRHLPVFEGVRSFARYQILSIFSLGIFTAVGIASLEAFGWKIGKLLSRLAAFAACAPVLAQAMLLIWNIDALPHAGILARYDSPGRPDRPTLMAMVPVYGPSVKPEERLAFIEAGYWATNCKEDILLPGIMRRERVGSRKELTSPPPERLVALKRNRIVLSYEPGDPLQGYRVNLPLLDTFRLNVPLVSYLGKEKVWFRRGELPRGRLEITAAYDGPAAGLRASLAGLVAALLFLGVMLRPAGRP